MSNRTRRYGRHNTLTLMSAGFALFAGATAANGQFASQNVRMHSWLDLGVLGGASGNDCWGYVSGSGREYALMSVSDALVVIEITDPANPVILDRIPHPNGLWGDVKVHGDFAYVTTEEEETGLQVIDLTRVDVGEVTLSKTIGTMGRAHNLAVDNTSGFLYTLGTREGWGTTMCFSLVDPSTPVRIGAGSMTSAYQHDAQIVTYDSGPYAGKQILFGASENRGVDVVDVTIKNSPFRLSRKSYPSVNYTHQMWVDEDRNYLYVNDELDEWNGAVATTRTLVFDISNLDNPVLVNTFTTNLPSTDHNLYIHNGMLFEANYTSGLRVFDLGTDPENPTEVAYFDTYPESNSVGFNGAWSVYPFLPSGNLIVSDIDRGMFILEVDTNRLNFEFPLGTPSQLSTGQSVTFWTSVTEDGVVLDPDSVALHMSVNGAPYEEIAMDEFDVNLYTVDLPSGTCYTNVDYYVSAMSVAGRSYTSPSNAPEEAYSATVYDDSETIYEDDFESERGWFEQFNASSGRWQRGTPVNDPDWAYDPETDGDGSGKCFLTQNTLGNTDVDEGNVVLFSPTIDMSGGNVVIEYDYFLFLNVDNGVDAMTVEINSSAGFGDWHEIARHTVSGGLAWRHNVIDQSVLDAAGVEMTDRMALRFTVNDDNAQSIVEAGLDGFKVSGLLCQDCLADFNGDGNVNTLDFIAFLQAYNLSDLSADLTGDGIVNTLDFIAFLNLYNAGC